MTLPYSHFFSFFQPTIIRHAQQNRDRAQNLLHSIGTDTTAMMAYSTSPTRSRDWTDSRFTISITAVTTGKQG